MNEPRLVTEDRVVSLGSVGWEDDVPGIRAREQTVDGRRWALVAYDEGARREEWCLDGHWGYVLRGGIEYEFDDGGEPLTVREGDAFLLKTGRGHRGRNLASGETYLFLIDDPA
jgi:quercetin dioxygenase-like cupin family protein